jgi:hypothetical protein
VSSRDVELHTLLPVPIWYDDPRMLRLCALLMITRALFAAPDSPVDDAVARLYEFDFPSVHRILDRYIAGHPDEPLPYAFRAAAYEFYEFDRMGILESEFLIDDNRIAEKKKQSIDPDPQIRTQFFNAVHEAEAHGLAALRANPDDRDALFTMCITGGLTTDYMALVEKHQFGSLTPAKRSNTFAQRLLKVDPKFYDAYLATGFSEYMIGSLPFFVKWFVHFDNVSGSKDRGKQNLEVVARQGHFLKPFAKILLGIISLREKHPQEAMRLLAELAHDFPENPLFRKELAKLSNRLRITAN